LAVHVANGKLTFGIADTDDVLEEIRGGQRVEIVDPPAADSKRKATVAAAERHADVLEVELLRRTGDLWTTIAFRGRAARRSFWITAIWIFGNPVSTRKMAVKCGPCGTGRSEIPTNGRTIRVPGPRQPLMERCFTCSG
jgi:hypothetical protein